MTTQVDRIRYSIKEPIDPTKDNQRLTLINKDDPTKEYGKLCPLTPKASRFLKNINESGDRFDDDHLFVEKGSELSFETDNILNGLYIRDNSTVTIYKNANLKNVILYDEHNLTLGLYTCHLENANLLETYAESLTSIDELILKDAVLNKLKLMGNVHIENSTIKNLYGVMKIQDSTMKNTVIYPTEITRLTAKNKVIAPEQMPKSIIINSTLNHVKNWQINNAYSSQPKFDYTKLGVRIYNSKLCGFFTKYPMNIKNTVLDLISKHADGVHNGVILENKYQSWNSINISDIDLKLNIDQKYQNILRDISNQQVHFKNRKIHMDARKSGDVLELFFEKTAYQKKNIRALFKFV